MTELNKADLCKKWLKAKKAETKAKDDRVAIEDEIIEVYGIDFEGQSKTFKEDDLDFSVNIKKNVSHQFDQDAWASVRADIPVDLRPEKIKFEVDVKGFEYLKENNSEIYLKVSDCVTIKDNKTTVKVEKIK
jgi:hypothetical protein